jgi:hypothetical protein
MSWRAETPRWAPSPLRSDVCLADCLGGDIRLGGASGALTCLTGATVSLRSSKLFCVGGGSVDVIGRGSRRFVEATLPATFFSSFCTSRALVR